MTIKLGFIEYRIQRWLPKIYGTLAFFIFFSVCSAQQSDYMTTSADANRFTLSDSTGSAVLCVSADDHSGVIEAFKNLKNDFSKVTGREPALVYSNQPN